MAWGWSLETRCTKLLIFYGFVVPVSQVYKPVLTTTVTREALMMAADPTTPSLWVRSVRSGYQYARGISLFEPSSFFIALCFTVHAGTVSKSRMV